MTHLPDKQQPAEPSAERAARRAERERRRLRAHAAAAALFGIEPRHRTDFAATFPDCQTPEFVELMIGLAREVRAADPASAADRLIVGLSAAEGAVARARDGLATTRAFAMAELGNAYRLGGRLDEAERVLEEARRQAVRLNDVDIQVRIAGTWIQIDYCQGRWDLMPSRLEDAFAAGGRASRHELGRLHLIAGISLYTPHGSLRDFDHLEAGLRLIDARREPRLVGVGLASLGYRLIRRGITGDGIRFQRLALPILLRTGSAVDRARYLWATSWADWVRGQHESAIDKLEITARRLASLGQPIIAGDAFLDLGRALACRGRWNQVEEVARKSLEIYGSCGSSRHQSIAETVIRQAGSTGRRSAERVEEAVAPLL